MSLKITKSEDCLIFYSLTPEVTKLKQVYSSLEEFMKKKQANDLSDRFNLIVFEKDGPYYLEDFTFDSDYILKHLKSTSNDFGKSNIAGGIFIAITFIIEVYKKISEKEACSGRGVSSGDRKGGQQGEDQATHGKTRFGHW